MVEEQLKQFRSELEQNLENKAPEVLTLFLKNLEIKEKQVKNVDDWCDKIGSYLFLNQLYSFKELVELLLELVKISNDNKPPRHPTYYKLRRLLYSHRPDDVSIGIIDNLYYFLQKYNIIAFDDFEKWEKNTLPNLKKRYFVSSEYKYRMY